MNLKHLNQKLDRLVSSLPTEHWLTLDGQHAVDAVVLEGLTKKFHIPDASKTAALHCKAVDSFIAWDENLVRSPILDRRIIRSKIQDTLASMLEGFAVDYADAWPGPGSSFISTDGVHSADVKLQSAMSVTPNCRDLLSAVLRSNRQFRRFIADRFSGLDQKSESAAVALAASSEEGQQHYHKVLFDVKVQLYLQEEIGSRFSTVPKNNEKRRPICIEPLGNTMVQRMIGKALSRCLTRSGNDIQSGQQRHNRMVASGRYASIDCSNASDSISTGTVRDLFPRKVVNYVMAARSPHVYIDGNWMTLKKVSSMGNGFTFELMTLLLLAALRTCVSDDVSVYGDDILVPLGKFNLAKQVVEELGFVINHDKSCGDGRKAESCGTFVVDNSVITRFDFNPIRNKVDLVNTYNKCLRIIESGQVSEYVTQVIAKILCWCRENLHVCNFGPNTRDLELPPWAMSEKWTGTEFQPASARFNRKVYLVKCPEIRLQKVHVKVDEHLSFMARLKAGQEVGHQNSYKEYTMDITYLVSCEGHILCSRQVWNRLET